MVDRRTVEDGSFLADGLVGSTPSVVYGTGRVCIEASCTVQLSRYNSTEWCALHESPAEAEPTGLGRDVQVLQPAVLGRGPDAVAKTELADAGGGRVIIRSREPELGIGAPDQLLDGSQNRVLRRRGALVMVTELHQQSGHRGGLAGVGQPDGAHASAIRNSGSESADAGARRCVSVRIALRLSRHRRRALPGRGAVGVRVVLTTTRSGGRPARLARPGLGGDRRSTVGEQGWRRRPHMSRLACAPARDLYAPAASRAVSASC